MFLFLDVQTPSDVHSETKVPGSSPASTYVERWALCSNCPINV